ncbi:MAG TPA: hypothetical protein VMI75_27965 [Polyangiaceae bacterium]|nr:hypothetical protein [Polyangiaceae bacterium]
MNSAPTIPRSNLKPPPLPKRRGLAVVPPADIEDVEDDLEVTAVAETPPEIIKAARSDIRELRAPRPAPPRPSSLPRPHEPVVKAIHPPPLSPSVAQAPSPVPIPVPNLPMDPPPQATPELETIDAIRPRPVVFARTAWFFGVYVTTAAFRWTVESLSRGRAWLAAEWRHAAIRANAPRQ